MMKPVYFDHSATTPVDTRVMAAMLPFFQEYYGNPSSLHQFGQATREAIERARGKVARAIHAMPEEIIFTSGGTESNNTVLFGIARALESKGKEIITTAIEHDAVLSPLEALAALGFQITYLPVDSLGRVSPQALLKAMTNQTILVSVMMVNNEVGTIQDIKTLAQLAHDRGILFHTDAVQALGKIPVDVNNLGVDFLSISAHKLYAPKGTGALFIRRGVTIPPYLMGGGHEEGRRSGTEHVPGIVGLGEAMQLMNLEFEKRTSHLQSLVHLLWKALQPIPKLHLNGPPPGEPTQRVPGNLHFFVAGLEGETALLYLDQKGFAVSTGSACSSRNNEPSHVLKAMGRDYLEAEGSLRLTLGKDNTEAECLAFLTVFREMLHEFGLST